jgi:hypothetical protein
MVVASAWTLLAQSTMEERCEYPASAIATKTTRETTLPTTFDTTFIRTNPMMSEAPEMPHAAVLMVSMSNPVDVAAHIALMTPP